MFFLPLWLSGVLESFLLVPCDSFNLSCLGIIPPKFKLHNHFLLFYMQLFNCYYQYGRGTLHVVVKVVKMYVVDG
jgi:hypothetical protein